MTRQALLRTVADIFVSNPNPNNPITSSQGVQQLLVDPSKSLDFSELIDAYYSGESKKSRKIRKMKLLKSICVIEKYNSKVDVDEIPESSAHFNSEQFHTAQKRLTSLRTIASNLIQQANSKVAEDLKYDTPRKYTGRQLHTLQDFYSHTNWIENWVDEVDKIIPYSVLGERNQEIKNVAADIPNPCSDCTYVRKLKWFPFSGFVIKSTSVYECNDNLDSTVKIQKLLTSGYTKGGKDTNNKEIVKPDGKCSHGGIIDGSTDHSATGGINKDSLHPLIASHYYYHREAADVAQRHSHQLLLSMRNDVQNDKLFSAFLGIEVELYTTIAVVVDTINFENC